MARGTGECGLRRRCVVLTLGQQIKDGAEDSKKPGGQT
jgi:hypothetical protein